MSNTLHTLAALLADNPLGLAIASIAALPIAAYLLSHVLPPRVHQREPPILRPVIPFIGHIVSLMREQNKMFDRLYEEKKLPICTLPMLAGRLYVINEPRLIAAAMRNPALSFDPFSLEFATSTLGMTPKHVAFHSRPGAMDRVTNVIHGALLGNNLSRMNAAALGEIAGVLNEIPSTGARMESGFLWLRELMAMATLDAMFGRKNPLSKHDLEDLWEFDKGLGLLALGIAQPLIAGKALAARNRLQKKLDPFYEQHLDEADDVSGLMRDRAACNRDLGYRDDELSKPESSMLFVSTSNTIPTLFWLFVHVFSDEELVAQIRAEAEANVTVEMGSDGRRVATMDVANIEGKCPVLHACYRETLRLYSDVLGTRRVMSDTILRDTVTGEEYLLRKGVNIQWSGKVTHHLPSIWGPDSQTFRHERFLDSSAQDEKKRKGAFIPFGGGKHLCPGRNFAKTELLGLVCALAVGFEVRGVRVPKAGEAYLGTGMRRPEVEGDGVEVGRREGWEGVTWAFKC